MDNVHESIHLTNNSVQQRYKNKTDRDVRLPTCNMWSLRQFKDYLKLLEMSDDTWDKKIYAGMKENIIAVVLSSLDETEFVENAFELYGCDFMLDQNYKPILIEVNSNPDMTYSTEVTAVICPQVLDDLVKVIVDVPKNALAATGAFEKVFEVNYKARGSASKVEGLNVIGQTSKKEEESQPEAETPATAEKPETAQKPAESKKMK